MHHVLGFLHHLAFSDPQRRLCHGHGKVVDFDTVKLADRDLNRIADVQHDLSLVEKGQGFIFQPPKGDVSLRQEVAGATGRVKKFQPRQLALKGFQFGLAGPLHRDGLNLRKLRFQPVQKQRVNQLVNVLNAGVVHPAGAPGFRVQRAFKDSPKDGGADGGPVKVLAGFPKNQVNDGFIQPGNYDVFICEQSAVDIGERR